MGMGPIQSQDLAGRVLASVSVLSSSTLTLDPRGECLDTSGCLWVGGAPNEAEVSFGVMEMI